MKLKMRYDLIEAIENGNGHPVAEFEKFCKCNNIEILKLTPQPIGDCWTFDVDIKLKKEMPSHITVIHYES